MPNAMNMPPPPKSPTRLIGGVGLLAGATEVRERAGERDVVDVVAGGLRHRTVLAPAGHAAVDELRVAGETHVGAETEPLGHARAVALERARRPARRAAARARRPRGSSGRRRSSAGRGTAARGSACRTRPGSPAARGRSGRCRRPCRRATSRRTGPARCRPARRSSRPASGPTNASTCRSTKASRYATPDTHVSRVANRTIRWCVRVHSERQRHHHMETFAHVRSVVELEAGAGPGEADEAAGGGAGSRTRCAGRRRRSRRWSPSGRRAATWSSTSPAGEITVSAPVTSVATTTLPSPSMPSESKSCMPGQAAQHRAGRARPRCARPHPGR